MIQRLLALAALLGALPAGAVTIDWVYVGNPGNAADGLPANCYGTECGSVAYSYYISKYEVTNAQYAEFLNAKAASDPLALYNTGMGSDATFGGITRSGVSGSYTYAAKAGFANKPVTYVSFYDALRFANWLNNGQGSASTEAGAYTLLGNTADPSNGSTVTRNVAAITFLPNENEWHKAAYYSPGGVYFDLPTGTNSPTACVLPPSDTGNSANCWPATTPFGGLTDVGAYTLSDSPYGTFDQGGNVYEWTEQINDEFPGFLQRQLAGGAWYLDWTAFASYGNLDSTLPWVEGETIGFRIASVIPEPGTALLVMTGLLGLACGAGNTPDRSRARRPERGVSACP